MSDKPTRRPADRYAGALGRAIRLLRTEQGLSRKELAAASGISYSYLAELENGAKPASSNALVAIADALGLSPQHIFQAAENLQARRRGESRYSLQSDVASTFRRTWQSQESGPARGSTARNAALRELADLIHQMDDDDLELLLEMARRLARRQV